MSTRCKTVEYPHDLPTASVVIVFKNERWSPVLRTVYSVLNRSPKHLLREVILVDDQSDIGNDNRTNERGEFDVDSASEEMGQRLDDYCDEHFGDFVRVLRAPTRLGLIKAKNFGARNGRLTRVKKPFVFISSISLSLLATGDVVVFLDAHCEANTGW